MAEAKSGEAAAPTPESSSTLNPGPRPWYLACYPLPFEFGDSLLKALLFGWIAKRKTQSDSDKKGSQSKT